MICWIDSKVNLMSVSRPIYLQIDTRYLISINHYYRQCSGTCTHIRLLSSLKQKHLFIDSGQV
jgi:hypothetical protein